jgi:hypothetical protein
MNLEANAVTVDSNWVERSALFRELAAERDEILKHKWLESEKVGRDVGFENAVMSWVIHHRAQWRRWHRQPTMSEAAGLISPGPAGCSIFKLDI